MLMKRDGRRSWVWPVLLIAAAGALAAAILWPASPLPVKTAAVTTGLVEDTVVASSVGTVEAEQTAVVSAEIAGKVKSIHVRQGAVANGANVVELDSTDLRGELERTRCDLQVARLRVDQARVRADKMAAELKRTQGTDESAWRIEALERDLAAAKVEVDIASASATALEAALTLVDLRLAKTLIHAPFDGVVQRVHVEVGENVAPGSRLFTVQGNPPFVVRAPIDEVDVPRVSLGQEARVTFDALRDRSFPGKLVEIRPAASTDQKNNRTVEVKVRVDDLPPAIVTGMSAHIEIIIARHPGVRRVATAHIREDHETKDRYVYLVGGTVARKRVIKTGIWNWEQTEVLEGLADGDRVIVRTVDADQSTQLKDGRRIKVEDGK